MGINVDQTLVIDVETTQRCPIGNNSANPFWPDNRVVARGQRLLTFAWNHTPVYYDTTHPFPQKAAAPWDGLVVGHNVGFDLHYLWKHNILSNKEAGVLQVWDTQLAAYLLSGQQMRFATLDELAPGEETKDEEVTAAFKAGLGADSVDKEKLLTYLDSDVTKTTNIFVKQFAEATDKGMLPLIWTQMDAKLACTEMTYNGMAVDLDFVRASILELRERAACLAASLQKDMTASHHALSLHSSKDLGTYLFGGTVKVRNKEEAGVYKNGNTKYKTVTIETPVVGQLNPVFFNLSRMKNGCWPTADDVLSRVVAQSGVYPPTKAFIRNLQSYRDVMKQLSTYFEAMMSLTMPDGRIHQNLNQCVTATGRLSSSEPNLQNVTDMSKSAVKKAYISRWGKNGVIIEADYSQLEMIALAILSDDKQLKEDIRKGVDMHTELYMALFARKPSKDERRLFKRCSFALVYGGGPGAISAQGGVSLQEARDFIKLFYQRYPGVKVWHDHMVRVVEADREMTGEHDVNGVPIGRSTFNNITGRKLVFREYAPDADKGKWKKHPSFSPTEIKNYPVQSLATADIVPMMLGRLFRVLKNNKTLKEKCLLINTVHDSVEMDCHLSVLDEALPIIKRTLESVRQVFNECFGFEIDMDFKVEVKYGPNWGEQVEWTPGTPVLLKEAA